MNKVNDYTNQQANTLEELEAAVQGLLTSGWQPLGQVSTRIETLDNGEQRRVYFQTLVGYEEIKGPHVISYRVMRSDNTTNLQNDVLPLIQHEGWQPFGAMVASHEMFVYQVLVQYGRKEQNADAD